MKRTDEQKEAFAKECREIEKAGGDVLEHIRIHYPSYTPRATWYGLQIQFLNRRPGHLTEGKPNATKERKRVKKHDTNDLLDRILQVIEDHGDPKQLLRDEGYTAPDQKWCSLRRWTLLHRPDDYEKLPADLKQYYADHGIQNAHRTPPPPPEPPKASGTWGEPDEAAETVIINGKEYEKMEKPSPTCCQPARESGVTLDDMPLEIVGIMSNVKGYYQRSCIENKHLPGTDGQYVHLIWRDLVTHDERSLGLSVTEWLQLAEEIPKAMRQLGLAN